MGTRLVGWAVAVPLLCIAPLLAAQAAPTPPATAPTDPTQAVSAKKVAILVGISAYPAESGFPQLHYAAKDAQDFAAELKTQGYDVQVLTDDHAMKTSIRKALAQAQAELNQSQAAGNSAGGTILFAFSGHGVETNTKGIVRQFLVTYDAGADDPEPGYPLKDITDALTSAGAAHVMMFLDACRNLDVSSTKGAPPLPGFSQLLLVQGMKILFSTAPGSESYEDAAAQNGYFTHYILEGLSGQAAAPNGLITFDGLANWVSRAMKADPIIGGAQVPYLSQSASIGDFYVAGHPLNKVALVVGIDKYVGHTLNSAIAGASQVNQQLDLDRFKSTLLKDATFSQIEQQLSTFAKNIGPQDVALFYFAGDGGVASGEPFLMPADAKLPDNAVAGKWAKPPANSILLVDVLNIVRKNHPGPNIFLLDMGIARASASDRINLGSLKQDDVLVLFSSRPGQEPARTEQGSLFSSTVTSVLKQPNLSAGYAVSKIQAAIFDQTDGVEYPYEVPMLPDRVYLTPSQ